MNNTTFWILVFALGVPWLYVAARVVTRGILRSISDHNRQKE